MKKLLKIKSILRKSICVAAIFLFGFCVNFTNSFANTTEEVRRGVIDNADQILLDNQIDDFHYGEVNEIIVISPLLDVLCQIILFLQGRFGRSIAIGGIVTMGIGLFLGKFTWTQMTVFGVGIGLLFGAKEMALVLLPYYLYQDGDVKVTTSEAISTACFELS